VDPEKLSGKGPYTAKIMLKSQPIPANIVVEIQDKGFDYGYSAAELGEKLIAGVMTLWTKEVTFNVDNPKNAMLKTK
jgi:hypothetical protein